MCDRIRTNDFLCLIHIFCNLILPEVNTWTITHKFVTLTTDIRVNEYEKYIKTNMSRSKGLHKYELFVLDI